VIRNITAGTGFLLAALAAIKAEETFLDIVRERAPIVQECGGTVPPRMEAHKTGILLKYLRTLLFLPFFGMMRPIELDDYEGRTFGLIASPGGGLGVGRYRSTDRFLRELTAMRVGDPLGLRLAADYCRVFYPEALNEGMRVFLDGHFKAVWTLKNVPRGKHGMMDRIMPGLEQVFLNGPRGHPLFHTTHPGDASLKDYILPNIAEFERAVGWEVVNLVVVDNAGCSRQMFEEFAKLRTTRERMVYLVTSTRGNQYRFPGDFRVRVEGDGGIDHRPLQDGDFQPFHKDRRGRVTSRVALAEFNYLANANRRGREGELWLRCAIVSKVRVDKLSIIVTDAPWTEIPSGEWLARCYYDRWPNQEARFKEMAWLCNLNVNHGFGKEEVPNRMALKRVEKLSRSLEASKSRMAKLDVEMAELDGKLLKGRPDGRRARQRMDRKESLKERRVALSTRAGKHQKALAVWKERLAEPFYEISTEMDHTMSVLKVLLENMYLYVHERLFDNGPPPGLAMLLRVFIDHQGDLEVHEDSNGGRTYRFMLDRFDSRKDRRVAKAACERVNSSALRTWEGVRIEMAVKG